MKKAPLGIFLLSAFVFGPAGASAQTPAQGPPPPQQARVASEAEAEKLFKAGNQLMDERKYADALAKYREALVFMPDDPSLLYNGSTAAAIIRDFKTVAELSQKLLRSYPEDWQSRAKLIQAYQALGDLKARDEARAALFDLRKSGKGHNPEDPEMSLAGQDVYCRERFSVAGREVMAFEHFELKGERALRYAFIVLDGEGQKEEFRISLGSYDVTNAVWGEMNREKAKAGRLFHLDGYYAWGHATYGMYHPEPSYDEIRKAVVGILEGKNSPLSTSTRPSPQAKPDEQKKP